MTRRNNKYARHVRGWGKIRLENNRTRKNSTKRPKKYQVIMEFITVIAIGGIMIIAGLMFAGIMWLIGADMKDPK